MLRLERLNNIVPGNRTWVELVDDREEEVVAVRVGPDMGCSRHFGDLMDVYVGSSGKLRGMCVAGSGSELGGRVRSLLG